MHQIQIEFSDLEDAKEVLELAEKYEDIEAIQEKKFSGDITVIELYISMAVNIITIASVTIKTLIEQKKISSLVIDGEKIELKNVPIELVEKVINQHLMEKRND